MKEITICPPGEAGGIKDYTAKSHKRPTPMNPKFFPNTKADYTLHRMCIYWFTYTVLYPKRLNRMDIITTKQFMEMLNVNE